jgi:hypothetical protein|tara:strand:+ start:468 stop:1004 length:537 start_codon:yes stop_codon:yes gene_type:complete
MSETQISAITLGKDKDNFSSDEVIIITARFSLTGGLRDAFTEKNWTEAYDANDNTMKLKYGIKLAKSGIRKHELGKSVDTYRKASIFWTRNPKLVNPMKERKIWVQVAKNFEPFVALTEEDVKKDFFDFEEKFTFKASELGTGKHKISAEAYASWETHPYIKKGDAKNQSDEIEISIN